MVLVIISTGQKL